MYIFIICDAGLVLPPGGDCGCTGAASGTLHRDSLPAESPWMSSLWKGSRRPKKKCVTGGQIKSWPEIWAGGGGEKKMTQKHQGTRRQ